MTDNATCSTCRHWNSEEKECWRGPPTPFPMPKLSSITGEPQLRVLSIRPPTGPKNWCGEWKEKAP